MAYLLVAVSFVLVNAALAAGHHGSEQDMGARGFLDADPTALPMAAFVSEKEMDNMEQRLNAFLVEKRARDVRVAAHLKYHKAIMQKGKELEVGDMEQRLNAHILKKRARDLRVATHLKYHKAIMQKGKDLEVDDMEQRLNAHMLKKRARDLRVATHLKYHKAIMQKGNDLEVEVVKTVRHQKKKLPRNDKAQHDKLPTVYHAKNLSHKQSSAYPEALSLATRRMKEVCESRNASAAAECRRLRGLVRKKHREHVKDQAWRRAELLQEQMGKDCSLATGSCERPQLLSDGAGRKSTGRYFLRRQSWSSEHSSSLVEALLFYWYAAMDWALSIHSPREPYIVAPASAMLLYSLWRMKM